VGSAIWSILREAASRGPSALADILVSLVYPVLLFGHSGPSQQLFVQLLFSSHHIQLWLITLTCKIDVHVSACQIRMFTIYQWLFRSEVVVWIHAHTHRTNCWTRTTIEVGWDRVECGEMCDIIQATTFQTDTDASTVVLYPFCGDIPTYHVQDSNHVEISYCNILGLENLFDLFRWRL